MVFLHPVHNYAFVAYDPSALGAVGASVVRAAELLPGRPLFIDLFYFGEHMPALCILDQGFSSHWRKPKKPDNEQEWELWCIWCSIQNKMLRYNLLVLGALALMGIVWVGLVEELWKEMKSLI